MERLRILVVDDEPGMRMGVARALRDYTVHLRDLDCEVGFEIDQAESGEVALEKIEQVQPDILLLDYKLPGLNGLDVLERIASRQGEMLTVMITAYASLDTAITATKRGAYDFLAKPFTPQELKNTVQKTAVRLILTRQARRLAEEKRRVRFQFISVVAHELKAPLAAIEGYLQIIRDRTVGDSLSAYDGMVDRSLVRLEGMRKLILDLLDMTRLEAGTRVRHFAEVDMAELARTAMETVAPAAAQAKITLELHAEGDVILHADRGEMEIVLNNLLSNAVKYNRPEGRVEITLRGEHDSIVVAVADTGIGMSPAECAKLFGEFVRIKNAQTRNIMGSGLGLSIVKKLAEMYDGSARVESTADVGTTFTITLGRHASPERTAAEVDARELAQEKAAI